MKTLSVLVLGALAGCSAVAAYSNPPAARGSGAASAPAGAEPAAASAAAPPSTGACDAAHDHCLPVDTWFAIPREWPAEQPGNATPTLWQAGEYGGDDWLWAWRCSCQTGSRGVRTTATTIDRLAPGAIVVYYHASSTDLGALPDDERDATREDWSIGTVTEVDRAGGRARIAKVEGAPWIPVSVIRLVVDEQDRFRPSN